MRGVSLLAVALAACSTSEVVVDGVTPDLVAPNAASTVTVHGAGFVNSLRGSVDNQPFQIGSDWTVTAGATATSVVRVDEGTLIVELPPLDEGTYDVTVRRPDGKSGTLPDGLRVGGDDLGMPDDLAGVDQSVADLTGGDLLETLDILPVCMPPNLPSTVGPGPDLAITLAGVKLNGVSNFAHVAAGGSFTVTANYKITDNADRRDQILIGIAPFNGMPAGSAQQCLSDEVVNGTKNGSATKTLTAPTQPGTYTLRFHYGQASSCDLSWWTTGGAPTAAEDFAAICVP